MLPGIEETYIIHNCCYQEKEMLYVGIRENGAPIFRYRQKPTGAVVLPDQVLNWAKDLDLAIGEAVLRGEGGDDHSQGYSLIQYPKGRAIQEKYIEFAARNEDLLRRVLHTSSKAEHRAIAADVIAYGKGKRRIVRDLLDAVSDPDGDVRNNATRALGIIAEFAAQHPSLNIKVPADPFIRMLNSYVWPDLNKAGYVLFQLTESRDPKLLEDLRKESLASLTDMAHWENPGHAFFALAVLGRIAGIPEKDLFEQIHNNREKVIAAAASSGP
jgi:hypothetical protein